MMDINTDMVAETEAETEAETIDIHQTQTNMDVEVIWEVDALQHTDFTLVDVITTEKEVAWWITNATVLFLPKDHAHTADTDSIPFIISFYLSLNNIVSANQI